MAFSTINSSQVDADSPLDTILMTQIKDNFDDLGAGITTASAFTGANLIDSAAGAFRTSLENPGSFSDATTSTSVFIASGSQITCARDGSFRVIWTAASTPSTVMFSKVFRNGTAVGATFANQGEKSDDITGNVRGDVLQIYFRRTIPNTVPTISNQYLNCSTATMILSAST